MKNRIFIAAVFTVLLLGITAGHVFGAEPVKKDETLYELKKELAGNAEILGMVPSLKAEQDNEGKIFYTFNGVKLESLAKEDLKNLSVRVHHIFVKMQAERIARQLKTTRPSTPPSLPKTPAAPPPTPPSSRR